MKNDELKTEDHPELLFLRALIDNVDSAILSILFRRAQLVNFIIEYKKLHKIDLSRSKLRENAAKETADFAAMLSLRKVFVQKILNHLFEANDHLYDSKISAGGEQFLVFNESMLQQFNGTLKSLDMSFCILLSERMQLVNQVGKYKKQHNILPLDQARWEAVLKSKTEFAESLGIDADAVRKLYSMIHEEALIIERQYQEK
ncbi:chorismate mutase [Candidiatus Paracoxiella cheracis]|uniref:chorismate mutase n=1 Tax=Candidiatus Paracoxiella cheracis TaxID=3405120 RepID=UPI003BF59671